MKRRIRIDNVDITICDSRKEMGAAAASFTEKLYRKVIENQGSVNMIFAAAPSQNEFLEALSDGTDIDFSRINAFHMDEYIGLKPGSPESFASYLRSHIFSKAAFRSVNYINGSAEDSGEECLRYGRLISSFPPDIVCAGVGENGHVAFNDPEVADFNDPLPMKVVTLDDVCRQQQVNDGCFSSFDEVPEKAVTLTVPTLMSARYRVFVIPSERKAKAVHDMFLSARDERVPASVIRGDCNSAVFLDSDSASLLLEDIGDKVQWLDC